MDHGVLDLQFPSNSRNSVTREPSVGLGVEVQSTASVCLSVCPLTEPRPGPRFPFTSVRVS